MGWIFGRKRSTYTRVNTVDDIVLLAKAPHELAQVVAEAVALLRSLGFTIHDVSQHQPRLPNFWDSYWNLRTWSFLWFMKKAAIIKSKCHNLVQLEGPTPIRDVASVVHLMVSAFERVQCAPLFSRSLENDKTYALKSNGWDLEGKMTPSPPAKHDLSWWSNKCWSTSQSHHA